MIWEPSTTNVQHLGYANDLPLTPLTPIKTPQSAKFDSPIFGTSIVTSTTFQSLETTADTFAYAAQQLAFGTQTNPNSSLRVKRELSQQDIDTRIASHVHHLSPNPYLDLPPVDQARRLISSPRPDQNISDDRLASPQKNSRGVVAGHMQTPPPTRSENTKNKGISSISMANRKSVNSAEDMRPPQTPNRIVEASPQMFPNLQFSPDLFQYPVSAPLTAPVIPQHRLFWDSNDDPGVFSSAYDDGFNPNATPNANPYIQSPSTSQTLQPQTVPSLQNPLNIAVSSPYGPVSSPTHFDGSVYPAPFTASPRIVSSRPDDPAMFLSSPARRFGPVASKTTIIPTIQHQTEREAYHHQIQESRRELEEHRSRRSRSRSRKQLAPSTLVPPETPQHPRPGITRSNTHSGIGANQVPSRRHSHTSFSDAINLARGIPQGGRSSPLKRPHDGSSLDIERPASRNRVSLSLTVDEDGRARTIARPITDTIMDEDIISETSSLAFEENDFDIVPSRPTSFLFGSTDTAGPHLGLLRPTEPSHSKSSSYSSAFGSSNSANPSSRTSSVRGGNIPNNTNNLGLLNRPGSPVKDQPGDAQQALRAVMREKERTSGRVISTRSRPTLQTFNSSPPLNPIDYDTYGHNISPTTITDPDLATPSTDRDSHVGGTTRCVCSSSDQVGRFMIQCESCAKWLHMKCVGLDPKQVPAVYVCIYCSQTPMRHGRIREPRRSNTQSSTSPLAHKSHRHR